ncbi:FtsX-like permease family protein [Pseudoflavitalea sp. G-6-1-2]|uniref:ABC transporter permease n=1 Tax=Pseudoflavitalea sp. G-6-1-2 TaxID=2728841 RepID=UPI00146C69C0|nr:ABC transporter permease [Pseudoflavitalea sp. G-6-1-2]NML23663.1 FtsX-like permease family protein [Pseudoflavitalea sp. G-6-1-2]
MLKHYFLTAIRNMKRNKVFSSINIIGLSLGLVCSLLITLWVLDEYRKDAFHVNKENLYSIYQREYYDNKVTGSFYTPGILAAELKKQLPAIENSTAIGWEQRATFKLGDKILQFQGNSSDSDFFKMFSYPLLEGNAQAALAGPNSIAISRSMAVAFFGTPQAAFGKIIRIDDRKDMTISAVYEDMPGTSSIQWDYIINWTDFLDKNSWLKEWGNNDPLTIVQLRSDADVSKFEAQIKNFITKIAGEFPGYRVELGLQKYTDKYLHSNFKDGVIAGGRIEYVRLFSIIAVFILLIACINFMNLTTARSMKRAREIGVRKVVGAIRGRLIRQFLGEAVVVTAIAMVFALILLYFTLPAFNQLTQKEIEFPFSNGLFWICIASLVLITGILSGSYPALFLSSFKPITVLKGVLRVNSASANWFRKGLVVFQFALSSLLIIGTIVVSQQVRFIQNSNLGYSRDHVLKITLQGDLPKHYESFMQRASQVNGISSVSSANMDPIRLGNITMGVSWEGKDPDAKPTFTQLAVGYDFLKTMEIQLKEGRDFSRSFGTDTLSYVLNETAVKKIGYTDPIGKPFTFWGTKGTIVGVVKDFNFNSLHFAINPLVLRLDRDKNSGFVLLRLEGSKTMAAMQQLEKLHKEFNPNFPFSYTFADDDFQKAYKSETLTGKLSNCFAALAIMISCLGLLGLAMFAAEQRVREIGIRKILGASLQSLFVILSKEFLLLVFIAFVIACPIAWWMMNNWLQDFEFRIHIDAWPFALAGIAAMAIALITISFQTIRAALANPVTSLKSE